MMWEREREREGEREMEREERGERGEVDFESPPRKQRPIQRTNHVRNFLPAEQRC